MRRSHPGIAFPIVRITLLIMVVACMASSMFASSGSRSLAFTSGGTSDLALQESDNPDPVWPDGIVTYTLTVTNNGPDNTDANLNGYICVGRFCNAGKVGPPRNVASSSQATFIDYTSTDPFWTCNIDPGVTQTPLSLNCSTNSTFVGTPPTTSTITIHLQAPSQEDVINSNFSVYNGNSDPDFSNNYANDTTVVANPCPPVFTSVDPPDGSTGVPTSGTITWTSSNAQFYNIYLGPAGTGCTTLFGSTTSPSIDYSLAPATVYEYRIDAISSNCPTTGTTDCLTFTTGGSPCSQTAPAPLAPLGASTVSSPVTFSWSSVPQATGYIVTTVKNGVNDSQTLGSSTTTTTKPSIGTTSTTSTTTPVTSGVNCETVTSTPTSGPPTAQSDPNTVQAGGDTSLTSEGFTSGEPLNFTLCSSPVNLGTVAADPAGHVVATVTIPASTTVGAHAIVVSNADRSRVAIASLTVIAPSGGGPTNGGAAGRGRDNGSVASGGGSALARTGAEVAGMTGFAVLALILGFSLMRAARFRRPLSR